MNILKGENNLICQIFGCNPIKVEGSRIHRCSRCGLEIDSYFITLDPSDLNILYVFDMDDTLVTTDIAMEKQTMFMTLDYVSPISSMMDVFNSVDNKVIMTSRHPALRQAITNYFGCIAICRNYCLTQEEMQKSMDAIENNNGEHVSPELAFIQEMLEWKTNELNYLSNAFDIIVFYDDCVPLMDVSKLNGNIEVRTPVYNVTEETK